MVGPWTAIPESHLMPGRPSNLPRNAARDAGEKTYTDAANPCFCGGEIKYVSNATCVECAIAKGKARYAALDTKHRAALRSKDHLRYEARVAQAKEPKRRRPGRPSGLGRDPLDP